MSATPPKAAPKADIPGSPSRANTRHQAHPDGGLFVVVHLGQCDSLGCKRWVDQDDQRHPEQSRDRCDVADEIEIQLLVERRVDRVRSNAGEKRVAVRGRTYNGLGGDIAASTGPVLDNKMLPQPLRQTMTDQTRGKVG